jgi:DNA-binding response OmpR family regulator
LTILLVDDEAATRTTLEKIFCKNGYCVLSAATAAEALAIFRSRSIDVVLLDFLLPDDEGTLGSQLKSLKPQVPIIVFSGDPNAQEAAKFADALVAKPAHPVELMRIISEIGRRAA